MTAPQAPEVETHRVVVEVQDLTDRVVRAHLGDWEVRITGPGGWGGADLLEDAPAILREARGMEGHPGFHVHARPFVEGDEPFLRGRVNKTFGPPAPVLTRGREVRA